MPHKSSEATGDVHPAPDDVTAEPSTTPGDELVIPVVAEELVVETTKLARGTVRVNKRIETREETVETPTVRDEVVVERVVVNRPVEGAAPQSREEGGVLVIPVLEEIAVVEKRLMLREEVRVSRRSTTTSSRQTVSLRREVVDVERVESDATRRADDGNQ